MKKILFLSPFFLLSSLSAFHAGLGISWNSIDENFSSTFSSNQNRSSKDRYEAGRNRLAPLVRLEHDFALSQGWLCGLALEWKYLNYNTLNQGSNTGQLLPSATFSSINFFGADVHRDFSSKSRLKSEVVLFGSIQKTLFCGVAYLGIGPAFIDASNTISLSAVHIPNGTGDHLITTSARDHKMVWGGAAQLGYRYFLSPCHYMNFSYTYLQTGKTSFKNRVNAAIFNGFDTPGPTTLLLARTLDFTVQEFILSMNLGF